jgi:FKBP-type peptidyl-prolyl cis-trans isomerase 2
MNSRVKLALLVSVFLLSIYSIGSYNPVIISGNHVVVEYSAWTGDAVFNTNTVNFTIGNSEVIPGLENAVVGMRVGETKNITIPPVLAYGLRDPELIYVIPVELFAQSNLSLPLLGDQFEIEDHLGFVIDVNNESVIIDANDPRAGLTFNMTIRVLNKI